MRLRSPRLVTATPRVPFANGSFTRLAARRGCCGRGTLTGLRRVRARAREAFLVDGRFDARFAPDVRVVACWRVRDVRRVDGLRGLPTADLVGVRFRFIDASLPQRSLRAATVVVGCEQDVSVCGGQTSRRSKGLHQSRHKAHLSRYAICRSSGCSARAGSPFRVLSFARPFASSPRVAMERSTRTRE